MLLKEEIKQKIKKELQRNKKLLLKKENKIQKNGSKESQPYKAKPISKELLKKITLKKMKN